MHIQPTAVRGERTGEDVVIAVRVVPESFLFRAREFHTTYHTKAPVTRVEWSDYWLWADGQYIPASQGGD